MVLLLTVLGKTVQLRYFHTCFNKRIILAGIIELEKLIAGHWRRIRDRLTTKKQWKSKQYMCIFFNKYPLPSFTNTTQRNIELCRQLDSLPEVNCINYASHQLDSVLEYWRQTHLRPLTYDKHEGDIKLCKLMYAHFSINFLKDAIPDKPVQYACNRTLTTKRIREYVAINKHKMSLC